MTWIHTSEVANKDDHNHHAKNRRESAYSRDKYKGNECRFAVMSRTCHQTENPPTKQ